MADFSNQSFGRYRLIELLDQTRAAGLYKALDTHLDCDVLVLTLDLENLPLGGLDGAAARFESEAKAAARLNHENLVKLMDFGEVQGTPFLVMEVLPGGNLRTLLKERGQIPWRSAVQIIHPLASALAYAHAQGAVHGELKPANILLTRSGMPKLVYFRTSRLGADESLRGLASMLVGEGTPGYLAPELINAKSVEAGVDIYALGVIFYEMITGQIPFQAGTPLAMLFKHATDPLPAPGQFVQGLPVGVEQIIFKALEKKPQDRYVRMAEFGEALRGISLSAPDPAPTPAQAGGIQPVVAAVTEEPKQPPSIPAPAPAPEVISVKAARPAVVICPTCGQANPPNHRFCTKCGQNLS